MIEVPKPKDIRKFEVKNFWVFTKRQFISIVISVPLAIIMLYMWSELSSIYHFNFNGSLKSVRTLSIMLVCIPCLLWGFASVQGIPFYTYVKDIYMRTFIKKMRMRPYIVNNYWRIQDEIFDEKGNYLDDDFRKQRKQFEQKKQAALDKKCVKLDKKLKHHPVKIGKNKEYTCYL